MKPQIVRVSEDGIRKAREALEKNHGGKQTRLLEVAKESDQALSSQQLTKFFHGEKIENQVAVRIFGLLRLKPGRGDIASVSESEKQANENDIDALVQQVRQKRHAKIEYQCGTMRMLDIEQPIDTTEIYTDVNILEKITSQQRREIPDLVQGFNPESDDFDRLGLGRVQKRVPGLEAVKRYSKLMVLGKPGAGKTTFLKWLAVKCNLGEFQPHLIPIFISLKDFAKNSSGETELKLFNYINNEQFRYCGIVDESVTETLLNQGRVLILLDGLDEVSEADEDKVIDEIRKFCQRYFQNQFIITCRIAAAKYRFTEENFTDVEVADFDSHQVETFAKKWFIAVAKNNREEGEATAKRFIEKLNLRENDPIRELAVTPILLNLTCFVFKEKGEFPSKRSKLYEDGLDILLVRWDKERKIKRDEVYQNLSLPHKIKLLSQVAAITFERGDYFFEESKVQGIIAEYLRSLLGGQTESETLLENSEVMLKSLEAQHGLLVERARGIYSFSHLTFQEYLTARYFVDSSGSQALENLTSHITEKRWREVFLLTAEMMPNAER
ncbi:NACHT domain-containing protein [Argonema galeatum]|uniref:NACHT domain-containing protein n=1 Tax=Argonema galeatum TaxID=2942762 RepID=UPI002013B271|nr:NACHT domain-containing NTPase [Argonema galeatum]MCL1467263.1 NACHT domain-containing NTPase [Argonema galeatum A003/A1]